MKKNILIRCVATFSILALSTPALAATAASFTPSPVDVAAGQQFNVTVMVSPQGTKDYAEKIEVDYPADLLVADSFTAGNGAMPLTQPGYDSTDNAAGILIKTSGYAGGIASPTMFGTILFTAKKAGSGTISIGGQSSSFQASGQTPITGTGAALAVSAGRASASTVVPAGSQSKPAPTPVLAPVTSVNGQTVTTTPMTAGTGPDSQVAAVDSASGSGSALYWILGVIVVVAAIYLLMRRRKGRESL